MDASDYYLSFVEFDDQGWFWDRRQMETLLRLLQREGRNRELLIVVFAHGWRHNANACDTNVVCFSRLLERLDLIERKLSGKNARKVVGVYLGWRGLSANVPPFELLSFWDRKNTAEKVGRGGVTEVLARLNDFRRFKNPSRLGDKTHLIITGHSFGGEVLFSALSNNLVERAVRTEIDPDTKTVKYDTASSFGDLVVLVNPAFEGNQYEALRHASINRCYSEEQRPVLLIITSKADQATRIAFPAGRFFSNLFETTRDGDTEQEAAIDKTIGHLDRYTTHHAKLIKESPLAKKLKQTNTTECGCPYLESTDVFAQALEETGSEANFFRSLVNEMRQGKRTRQSDGEMKDYYVSPELAQESINYGDEVQLTRHKQFGEYATNYPYFVISTDGNLISGHNEIYGEDFTNFVRRFYIRHIVNKITFPKIGCDPEPVSVCVPTDIETCERSFRRKPRSTLDLSALGARTD